MSEKQAVVALTTLTPAPGEASACAAARCDGSANESATSRRPRHQATRGHSDRHAKPKAPNNKGLPVFQEALKSAPRQALTYPPC